MTRVPHALSVMPSRTPGEWRLGGKRSRSQQRMAPFAMGLAPTMLEAATSLALTARRPADM